MKELHTQMDKHGRLLIPARLRNSLNYKPGESFIIRTANDELYITTLSKVVANAQNLFKQHNKDSTSAVEEFLKRKHLEANKENSKALG